MFDGYGSHTGLNMIKPTQQDLRIQQSKTKLTVAKIAATSATAHAALMAKQNKTLHARLNQKTTKKSATFRPTSRCLTSNEGLHQRDARDAKVKERCDRKAEADRLLREACVEAATMVWTAHPWKRGGSVADIQPLAFALGLPYLSSEVKKEDMKTKIEERLLAARDELTLDPRFAQL